MNEVLEGPASDTNVDEVMVTPSVEGPTWSSVWTECGGGTGIHVALAGGCVGAVARRRERRWWRRRVTSSTCPTLINYCGSGAGCGVGLGCGISSVTRRLNSFIAISQLLAIWLDWDKSRVNEICSNASAYMSHLVSRSPRWTFKNQPSSTPFTFNQLYYIWNYICWGIEKNNNLLECLILLTLSI